MRIDLLDAVNGLTAPHVLLAVAVKGLQPSPVHLRSMMGGLEVRSVR